MHVVYLHGFASSPASSKAIFLKNLLLAHGVEFHCPDLNHPDFSTMTVSRMVKKVQAIIEKLSKGPVVLCGSSLGAFVALHAAERMSRPIDRMILLAPAFDFGRRAVGDLGEEGMARWKDEGWWTFTHYATEKPQRVHYELFRDAAEYDSFGVDRVVPTLIVQGRYDVVVDPDMVEQFSATRPHVDLVMVDDDHQLGASLACIWDETTRFLSIAT
ncbi:alpha/beta fold hydrolase [bacterium]|nr:MAG: alpha/beta fold hydrolase [bacterium]